MEHKRSERPIACLLLNYITLFGLKPVKFNPSGLLPPGWGPFNSGLLPGAIDVEPFQGFS